MPPPEPRGIRLGVVRGISYGLFGPPGEFGPQARVLGAGLIRAYLYWSQVEPAVVFSDNTYFCPRDTLRPAGWRTAEVRGAIMHPMFVELYLQADADQDEQDRRRRAARTRRLRSRTALRVATPAPVRDRRPQQ